VVLAGCLGGPGEETPSGWRFVDVADEAGIEKRVGGVLLENDTHPYSTLVGGAAVADVDGDGWQDILVADARANRLFLNEGDGTFTDATDGSGIPEDTFTVTPLFLDVENDGDPDLFLGNDGEASRLLRNDGDGTFTDVTPGSGVGKRSSVFAAAAADVDGDGFLDLSVGNYGPIQSDGPENRADATDGAVDLLYMNQGGAAFSEQGHDRGIAASRWTLSHAWNDVDRDGDPDLYMNVDFGYDVLYENHGGFFGSSTEELGLVTNGNGMGARWVDVDGDADLDLFVTNIHLPHGKNVPQFRGNNLFVQGPDGTFADRAAQRGIADGGWGWDSAWQDFDHDGDVDAVQTNGMVTREEPDSYYDATPELLDEEPETRTPRHALSEPYNDTKWLLFTWNESVSTPVSVPSLAKEQVDRVFENRDGTFVDVAGEVGLEGWTDGRAAPALDFDHDGDMDLVRTAFDRKVELLENKRVDGDVPDDAHWLQVELVGTASNRDAVGARVLAEAGDETILRHRSAGGGFMAQSQPGLHLGLGTQEAVDELTVTWPDGTTATFTNVTADQRVRITQPDQLETGVWS
jgi:hypothetical protein